MTATNSSKAKNRCTIYREHPAFFSRQKCKISFVRRTAFTGTSKWSQVRKFSASLTFLWQKRQVTDSFDLLLQSFTGYDGVAMELLPCFSVFGFQIFKRFFRNIWSPCTKCWCGKRRVAFGAWLLVQLLQPLLLVEVHVRALYYSPLSFQPNPSLTISSASCALPVQTKTDTTSSFFSKAFEPILRHVLRDKMTPLYLVICFVTCLHTSYCKMAGLVNG